MSRRDFFQIFCLFYLQCITRKYAQEKKTLISNLIPEQVQKASLLQIDCQMIIYKTNTCQFFLKIFFMHLPLRPLSPLASAPSSPSASLQPCPMVFKPYDNIKIYKYIYGSHISLVNPSTPQTPQTTQPLQLLNPSNPSNQPTPSNPSNPSNHSTPMPNSSLI